MKDGSEFSYTALLLLLLGGICMGSFPPLSKIAMQGGIPPFSYMFHAAAGATLGLAIWVSLFERRPAIHLGAVGYCLIAGATGYVLPSILTVWSVTRLGAGLVAMTFTLVPVLTYALALLFRLEACRPVRVAGIASAFCGAVFMTAPNVGSTFAADTIWLFIVLFIPISLSVSGIYRSIAWPQGYSPAQLAAGMLFMSALMLGAVSLWSAEDYLVFFSGHAADWIVLLQMVAAFLSYVLVFKVQQDYGPVFQSLMGYVSTATGVLVGYLIFQEEFSAMIWVAFGFLVLGMILVNRKSDVKRP